MGGGVKRFCGGEGGGGRFEGGASPPVREGGEEEGGERGEGRALSRPCEGGAGVSLSNPLGTARTEPGPGTVRAAYSSGIPTHTRKKRLEGVAASH
jgi:hypothetical protein